MELSRLAVSLILISVLSFARAQVDCPPFNVSQLGATDMLTRGGLIGAAFTAVGGDPSNSARVQVHDSRIVCLRSGRTLDTYSGVSVVVNYTCTDGSVCTGTPILSQFEFECAAGPTWTASVDGSTDSIITTPSNGTLSTTLRTDCGVCVSPARSGFAPFTDNEQHCGSCNSACNVGLMRCFNRLVTGCCNFFENNMCEESCTSPLVPNSNSDCVRNCSFLPDLNNGMLIYNPQGQDQTLVGATATYTCDMGYTLGGNNVRTCQTSGEWSGSDPNCTIVDCGSLNNPLNGMVDISQGTTYNAMATYSCNSPYTLNGDMTRTCQADGTWSGEDPTCVILCDPPCVNGFCENGTCMPCPAGRFGENCTGICADKVPECRVCVNGTLSLPTCTGCVDGNTLDSQTNECKPVVGGGGGCDARCIAGAVIGALLGALLLAAITAAIIYALYKHFSTPATQLKKGDTEGLNGVAKDNPLYVDPSTVEEQVGEDAAAAVGDA